MKRIITLLFVLLSFSLLGAQVLVYPTDNELGQCVSSDSSEQHIFINRAVSEPYSFEWAETYMHPDFKKNLALVFSSVLSDTLPMESALYSRSSISSEGTYVISVKNLESGKILSFAIFDGFISAILN